MADPGAVSPHVWLQNKTKPEVPVGKKLSTSPKLPRQKRESTSGFFPEDDTSSMLKLTQPIPGNVIKLETNSLVMHVKKESDESVPEQPLNSRRSFKSGTASLNLSAPKRKRSRAEKETEKSLKKSSSRNSSQQSSLEVNEDDKGCHLCQKNDGVFMIECTQCREWFHGSCVGITQKMAEGYEYYHCRACAVTKGPSIKKPPTNNHRQDPYELDAHLKKTESGSPQFMEELKMRKFMKVETIIKKFKGRDLNTEFLREDGFEYPILIPDRAGLELVLPPENFSYERVVSTLGPDRSVIAIDVPSQEDGVELRLGQYLAYMNTAVPRETILNIISLEFTNTPLAGIVQPPLVVRELSWADNLFAHDESEYAESGYTKPEVQKYCLMSAEGSYTDFHIDFAGTSVWYHIFRGAKVFYLIPPTDQNLRRYEEWMQSEYQSERFLGDEADCYKLELAEGETILLPSGWIHAVYTPVDSLVFGGNFLHHLASKMQICINDMETRLNTPDRYRYPHFHTSCWLALRDAFEVLEETMKSRKMTPKWILRSCIVLYNELKNWIPSAEGEEKAERLHQIPATIKHNELLRKVQKLFEKLPAVDK